MLRKGDNFKKSIAYVKKNRSNIDDTSTTIKTNTGQFDPTWFEC